MTLLGYDSPKPGPEGAIEQLDERRRALHDEIRAAMNCQELIEFCLDYIEGVMPDDEQVSFRRHLGQCSDCVTFFETYRKTPELTREALATKIPASVRESVRSFLQSRRDR